MCDVVVKLFAAVLADRLTCWAIANYRLSAAQKGFLPHEGCLEHSFMLHRVLKSARARKKEVVVAWLDLADAFGHVPHAVILRALVDVGVPTRVVDTVASLYQGTTVRVRTRDGYTEAIPMLSGVRQGCPLSTILFDLVIDPLVRSAEELVAGFEVYEREGDSPGIRGPRRVGRCGPEQHGVASACSRSLRKDVRTVLPPVSVQRCTEGRKDSRSRRPSNSRASIGLYLTLATRTCILDSPRESESTRFPTAPSIN